ncbi:MAG: Ig-like domain-containing protein [Bacteroidales bacterium]|nr:Ig-like domain-containing protein [Bacteroidales bacterium]MCL2133412.1 Ig-like domain-containing protein [Bacteroidales bacterium]
MKKNYLFLIKTCVVLSLFFAVACSGDDSIQTPVCKITNPLNNAEFSITEDNIEIAVTVNPAGGTIVEVQLMIDNVEYSVKTTAPYNFTVSTDDLAFGTHTLKAIAQNHQGTTGESAAVSITVIGAQVGQAYQGGIIAYVDETGRHGLIAAPEDQSDGILWWNGSYIETGATATAIGTGKSNTEKIIEKQGAGAYAAQLCDDLVIDDYDDWFLPSQDELNILYVNRIAIGGFMEAAYWSSSESDNYGAWYQYFANGFQSNTRKDSEGRVRAVRAF